MTIAAKCKRCGQIECIYVGLGKQLAKGCPFDEPAFNPDQAKTKNEIQAIEDKIESLQNEIAALEGNLTHLETERFYRLNPECRPSDWSTNLENLLKT